MARPLPGARVTGTRVAVAIRFCRLMPIDRAPGRFEDADHDTPASFEVTTVVTDELLAARGLTIVAELTGITWRMDLVAVDEATEVTDATDVRITDRGIRGPVAVDVEAVDMARIRGRTIGTPFLISTTLAPDTVQLSTLKTRYFSIIQQKHTILEHCQNVNAKEAP